MAWLIRDHSIVQRPTGSGRLGVTTTSRSSRRTRESSSLSSRRPFGEHAAIQSSSYRPSGKQIEGHPVDQAAVDVTMTIDRNSLSEPVDIRNESGGAEHEPELLVVRRVPVPEVDAGSSFGNGKPGP